MTTHMVALTDAEIGLLRAGLAAHSNLMDPYIVGDDPVAARIARIKKTECRELSARLGTYQIEATESKHRICTDVPVSEGGCKGRELAHTGKDKPICASCGADWPCDKEDGVETVIVQRDGEEVILVVERVDNGFDVHAVRSDGDPYATMTVYDAS